MATTITDIRKKVQARIKDAAGKLSLTPDMESDVDRCITSAVELYQKQRPRELAVKLAGDGGFDYALPAGFVDRFSRILAVYYPHPPTSSPYPYGPAGRDRKRIDEDQYEIVRLDTGLRLRFLRHTPGTAESFLVQLTAPHTLDAGSTTIPATDDEAIADLGAAHCCDALAALYSQETDPSIQADAVNRLTKAAEYRSMASSLRKSYDAKMATPDRGLGYRELRRA